MKQIPAKLIACELDKLMPGQRHKFSPINQFDFSRILGEIEMYIEMRKRTFQYMEFDVSTAHTLQEITIERIK